MGKEAKRQEYILEKIGRIYKGTFKRISDTPWDFGQVHIGLSHCCKETHLSLNITFTKCSNRQRFKSEGILNIFPLVFCLSTV